MNGLLALAFGAGLLAPINPCGFGLLPAMLTATLTHPTGSPHGTVGRGGQRGLATRLGGGLRAGLALTLGFTATFTLIGFGLSIGIQSLIGVVPWLAATLGVGLILIGIALLTGWHLPLRLPFGQPDPTRAGGTGRIVLFGAGYAVASASCTLAVLLAVVTQAASTTLIGAVAVFTAYAAGSALLLITLALLTAVAGHSLAHTMQRLARYTGPIAGALLAISGAYLLYYWIPQLLIGTHTTGDTALAAVAGSVATAVSEHEPLVILAAVAIVALAAITVIRHRHHAEPMSTQGAAQPIPQQAGPDDIRTAGVE